jgi:dipeptide/tripeptide permease
MRALLVLFMVAPPADGGLGFTIAEAAMVYGNYTMAVYMLSIPGGFIADRWLGATRAVLIGGAIIALGHFTLALHATAAFYAGLVFVALGTGLSSQAFRRSSAVSTSATTNGGTPDFPSSTWASISARSWRRW